MGEAYRCGRRRGAAREPAYPPWPRDSALATILEASSRSRVFRARNAKVQGEGEDEQLQEPTPARSAMTRVWWWRRYGVECWQRSNRVQGIRGGGRGDHVDVASGAGGLPETSESAAKVVCFGQ